MAASPYDPEVHYAKKRSTTWIGYKVHLTETCDEGGPHLITHVETTPAPVVDRDALEDIHEALKAKGLLPDTHLVDAGYVAADQLVASRKKGVTLLGPAPKDYQWQAQSGEGFTLQDFLLDWDRRSGDLSGRAREPKLGSRLPPGADGLQGSLLDDRLSTLSLEGTVYPERPAPSDAAATRGTRDPGGGSRA